MTKWKTIRARRSETFTEKQDEGKTYNSNVFIKDKEGNLIGGKDQVKERCKEYFNELLNGDSEEEVKQEVGEDNREIAEPARGKVEEILRRMKIIRVQDRMG